MNTQSNETTEHPRVKPPVLVRYGKIADVCREHGLSAEIRDDIVRACEIAADRESTQLQFWHPINAHTEQERALTSSFLRVADALKRIEYPVRYLAGGWLIVLDLEDFCR